MKQMRWKCPRCNRFVTALAEEVVHRCPNDKNKHVQFKREEPDEQP